MSAWRSRRCRRTAGLGMLEVLLALALTPVVLAGIHSSYRTQVYLIEGSNAALGVQDTVRGALDRMVREIRMAGYDPTGTALPVSGGPACPGVSRGITEASATRVHIRADLDGDGATTNPGEDVLYEYDEAAGEIRRADVTGTVTLIDGVPAGGLMLRYYDSSDPPVELVPAPALTAAELDCVGAVAIVVRATVANPDPQVDVPLASAASSLVAVRSRSLMSF